MMFKKLQPEAVLLKTALAIVIGVLVALFIQRHLFTDIRGESMLQAGDLPAFYIAAKLINENPTELYNFTLQQKLENEIWPLSKNRFYVFPYPPFTALALSPLSLVSPEGAKIILLIINTLAFLAGAFLLGRIRKIRLAIWLPMTAIILFSSPMGISILGSQNTGVTFLFLSLFLIGIYSRTIWWGELIAGVSVSLLLYKPQFALVPIIVLFAIRAWRSIGVFGAVAFVLYFISVPYQGWDWPMTWLASANHFGFTNFIINSHHMISLHGTAFSFIRFLVEDPGTLRAMLKILDVTIILMALLFGYLIHQQYRKKKSESEHHLALLSLIPLLTVLLPPQTLFYDLGVPMIAFYLFFVPDNAKSLKVFLTFILMNAALFVFRVAQGPSLYGLLSIIGTVMFLIYYRSILRNESHNPITHE